MTCQTVAWSNSCSPCAALRLMQRPQRGKHFASDLVELERDEEQVEYPPAQKW